MIKLEKAATKIMAAIGTAVMLFLLFYSWKYTKKLVEPEYYLDEADSILRNALLGIVLVAVCAGLWKGMQRVPAKVLHVLALVSAVAVAVIGIRLARAAGAVSIADQYYVQRAAMALADGDTEWVLSQDYYGIYPFQLGLAEIFSLFFRVAGSMELSVIQQVQAVCGGITLYVGFRIVRELSGNRVAELLYLVTELLFLPVYCYSLYIYGESIGTCSVMCAIWCYLMANRPEGKVWQKGLLWIAVALFMGLAYVTRNVFLVVWIAMTIMQILVWLRSKKWQGLPVLCVVLAVMLLGKNVLCHMAEGQLDREYGSGAPYVLWIAMGMQENPDARKGPGTYNDYNLDTYMRAGYDSREAAEVAKGDIRQRFSQWREDPAAAVTFIKEKLLIQWIEPTYCSFNQTRYQYRPEGWVEELYTGQANERALAFLNRYQSVVYLAVFGYYLRILLGKLKGVQILPGIIFLGGFFITILWEAKSRYVYPYIVMILPCAACSITYYSGLMTEQLKKMGRAIKGRKQKQKEIGKTA